MNVTNEKTARGSVLRPLLIITIVATLIGAALRCVNLFSFFDEEIGYFEAGALLPTVMHIFFALFVAFFLVCSVILRKKKLVGCDDRNIFVAFSSAFAAITLLIIAFFTVYSYAALSAIGEANTKTLFFAAALALSSVYFFMNTTKRPVDSQGLLVVVLIASVVFIVATLYFDVTIPMNSPNQILFNMAAISSLLFFVSESKARVGTEKTWLYVFSLCFSTFTCGVYAIPSIIRFGTLSAQFNVFALFLSFFIYFLSRLICLLTHSDEIFDRCEELDSEELPEPAAASDGEDNAEEGSEGGDASNET
ncbi:MAG: hypothetical protein E7641_03600 [Ruminococcaceae bacterium]|nr:hypothetical protein [Oscillospiraceae bacterium]